MRTESALRVRPEVALGLVALCLAGTVLAGEPVKLRWAPLYEPGCGGWITSVAISPHDPKRVLVGGDMLGVGLSEDGGESWQSTFGFSMWEIADFTFHPTNPNVIWVGTMGGPYVSADGGDDWQMRRTGFPPRGTDHYSAPIEKVLICPNDRSRLLLSTTASRPRASPSRRETAFCWSKTPLHNSERRARAGPTHSGAGHRKGDNPEAEGARTAMGHRRTMADRMNLAAMTPRNDLASTQYWRANRGKEYLVYLPDGGEVTVDLSAVTGTLAVEWFNPRTSVATNGGPVQGGAKRAFRAPFEGDAVLYLVRPTISIGGD